MRKILTQQQDVLVLHVRLLINGFLEETLYPLLPFFNFNSIFPPFNRII